PCPPPTIPIRLPPTQKRPFPCGSSGSPYFSCSTHSASVRPSVTTKHTDRSRKPLSNFTHHSQPSLATPLPSPALGTGTCNSGFPIRPRQCLCRPHQPPPPP